MKIGIIALNAVEQTNVNFYNSQEIGLGRALTQFNNKVSVYILVKEKTTNGVERAEDNLLIYYISVKHIGTHAITLAKFIDNSLDILICASDNCFCFYNILMYCNKFGIICIPYIGVLMSNNGSWFIRKISDTFIKNIREYRKLAVLAKTPAIEQEMQSLKICNTQLFPVGLDEFLLKREYGEYNKQQLKNELGYSETEKILLFVGRLWEEKQPVKMIDIFADLFREDNTYRLIIIGKGPMYGRVKKAVEHYHLNEKIRLIDKVNNENMWRYYRSSYAFINLNVNEIYGMALLEAMYYECRVIAMHAPGPDYIIENEVSGYLCNTHQEIKCILINNNDKGDICKNAHDRVKKSFLWVSIVKELQQYLMMRAGKSN